MNSYCIAITTFETQEQAKPIIDRIISEKLGACVQCLEINSSYCWNGEVCNEPEILVLIKTRDELFEPLKAFLLETHPYDTPEIIKVPIESGSIAYLSWIDEATK